MKIQLQSIKDLLEFTKMALYMTDKAAGKKMLKWKQNKELVINKDETVELNLPEDEESDREFNVAFSTKLKTWLSTNKQTTLLR